MAGYRDDNSTYLRLAQTKTFLFFFNLSVQMNSLNSVSGEFYNLSVNSN